MAVVPSAHGPNPGARGAMKAPARPCLSLLKFRTLACSLRLRCLGLLRVGSLRGQAPAAAGNVCRRPVPRRRLNLARPAPTGSLPGPAPPSLAAAAAAAADCRWLQQPPPALSSRLCITESPSFRLSFSPRSSIPMETVSARRPGRVRGAAAEPV